MAVNDGSEEDLSRLLQEDIDRTAAEKKELTTEGVNKLYRHLLCLQEYFRKNGKAILDNNFDLKYHERILDENRQRIFETVDANVKAIHRINEAYGVYTRNAVNDFVITAWKGLIKI